MKDMDLTLCFFTNQVAMDKDTNASIKLLLATLQRLNIKSQFWGVQLDQIHQNSFLNDLCIMGNVQTEPMPIENDIDSKLMIFTDSFQDLLKDFETSDIFLNVYKQTFIKVQNVQRGQTFAWRLTA